MKAGLNSVLNAETSCHYKIIIKNMNPLILTCANVLLQETDGLIVRGTLCTKCEGTNSNDVMIILIICATVTIVAITAAITVSIWHKMALAARTSAAKAKFDDDEAAKENEARRRNEEKENELKRYKERAELDKDKKGQEKKESPDNILNLIKEIGEASKDRNGYVNTAAIDKFVCLYKETRIKPQTENEQNGKDSSKAGTEA